MEQPQSPFDGLLGDLLKILGGQGGGAPWLESARALAVGVATDNEPEGNPDPLERIALEQVADVARRHVEMVTGQLLTTSASITGSAAGRWGWAAANSSSSASARSTIALAELDTVLKAGARCVGIRPAPVPGFRGSRSFGFPEFDPFWARCAEAKIFVCLHTSDSGYDRIYRWWTGGGGEYLPFEKDAFNLTLETLGRPIADSLSALICHGALDRHPDLRIVSVENGAEWVRPLLKRLDKAHGQMPGAFRRHPRETFQRQVFVAPFYEDSMAELAQDIPVERILFGSDFPHPEGLAEPLDYLKEFRAFSDGDIKRIFHTNMKGLLEGARD